MVAEFGTWLERLPFVHRSIVNDKIGQIIKLQITNALMSLVVVRELKASFGPSFSTGAKIGLPDVLLMRDLRNSRNIRSEININSQTRLPILATQRKRGTNEMQDA